MAIEISRPGFLWCMIDPFYSAPRTMGGDAVASTGNKYSTADFSMEEMLAAVDKFRAARRAARENLFRTDVAAEPGPCKDCGGHSFYLDYDALWERMQQGSPFRQYALPKPASFPTGQVLAICCEKERDRIVAAVPTADRLPKNSHFGPAMPRELFGYPVKLVKDLP